MAAAAARLARSLSKRAQEGSSDGTDTTGPFNGVQSDDDYGDDDYDGPYGSWWWSPTGMAVRYTIIVVLFLSIGLFLLSGYYHARRRMRRGLTPLPYHAWMVRRSYRQPQHYYQQSPLPQNGYSMNGYQNPPPAYNPYSAPPPAYQPPEGASKVLADQQGFAQAQRAEEQGESSSLMTPPTAATRQ